jgi:hypothetical protein
LGFVLGARPARDVLAAGEDAGALLTGLEGHALMAGEPLLLRYREAATMEIGVDASLNRISPGRSSRRWVLQSALSASSSFPAGALESAHALSGPSVSFVLTEAAVSSLASFCRITPIPHLLN